MIVYDSVLTPFGPVYIAMDAKGLCKLALTESEWQQYSREQTCSQNSAACASAVRELQEYFNGERKQFTIPLNLTGTDFFRQVWQEVSRIPYGETCTYADIAHAVGHSRAYRAVGLANYNNPVPIIIPCHRVIGKNGKMIGYKGSNTLFKEYLLKLEGAY